MSLIRILAYSQRHLLVVYFLKNTCSSDICSSAHLFSRHLLKCSPFLLDAIAFPSSYPCQWVSQSVSQWVSQWVSE